VNSLTLQYLHRKAIIRRSYVDGSSWTWQWRFLTFSILFGILACSVFGFLQLWYSQMNDSLC